MSQLTIHPVGKIDIHNRTNSFITAFDKLKTNGSVIPENRDLIVSFINDCRLGKTILGRSKKKIGVARCLKYISILTQLPNYFNCSFNEITQQDMERFISDLETDKYKSVKGKPYAPETKADIKKPIKKFWKWKDGNNF